MSAKPFLGRTHAEVLDLDYSDAPSDLIENLVPRAVVITTAGLPETYKGWVCAKKAEVIARGEGEVLGCPAVTKGPVGYFWQDDSERNEAERVQLFARVHETPSDLDIRWFLNEGLILPRDLGRLRATIEHYGLIYAVLDSFYNVAGEADLKDRDAGLIFAALKSEVCDPTGCTIDVVDHMPWATDTNRKRLRGYGDVFKNAAIRAGLYIDADGTKLYVEARGNNIRGFKRTPAYWDAEALELRLVDTGDHQEKVDERVAAVIEILEANPRAYSKTEVRKAVGGRAGITDEALKVLIDTDRVLDLSEAAGTGTVSPHGSRGYIAAIHAGLRQPETLSLLDGTAPDSPVPGVQTCPPVPTPLGGQGLDGTGSDEPQLSTDEQLSRLIKETS